MEKILLKEQFEKLKRVISSQCEFIIYDNTVKMSYSLKAKDHIRHDLKNLIIYQFTCPGCKV